MPKDDIFIPDFCTIKFLALIKSSEVFTAVFIQIMVFYEKSTFPHVTEKQYYVSKNLQLFSNSIYLLCQKILCPCKGHYPYHLMLLVQIRFHFLIPFRGSQSLPSLQPAYVSDRVLPLLSLLTQSLGFVGSNPTQSMDGCLRLLCVCVVLCR
jgi:hypothetical protein